MEYNIKVKHRKFLNSNESNKLRSFGIKTVLNNQVYDEYSSHMVSIVNLNDESLFKLKQTFKCEVTDSSILIDMEK